MVPAAQPSGVGELIQNERFATVRPVIGARAVTALVSRREDEHRDRSLARALLRAQSIDWPWMSAVLRACDL